MGQVSPEVDMWALGVSVYLMLSHTFPFPSCTLSELYGAHRRPLDLHSDSWQEISEDAKEFVRGLLATDRSQRLTVEQAFQSGWLWLSACDRLSEGPLSWRALPEEQACRSEELINYMQSIRMEESQWVADAVWKTLYLIRHGEAIHNIQEREAKLKAQAEAAEQLGLEHGSPEMKAAAERARKEVLKDKAFYDAPLSTKGKAMALETQAKLNILVKKAEYSKPSAVLVSPLERTLQTAALVFPKHPNTRVVEALRERQTGMPCDQHKSATEVFQRETFCHMNFRAEDPPSSGLHQQQLGASSLGVPVDGIEDAMQLRVRTQAFIQTLAELEDETVALVTHKGFLRELERGPFGNPDATEFDNCEVRVYDIALPRGGGPPLAELRYRRGKVPELPLKKSKARLSTQVAAICSSRDSYANRPRSASALSPLPEPIGARPSTAPAAG